MLKTVGDLLAALSKYDPALPLVVHEGGGVPLKGGIIGLVGVNKHNDPVRCDDDNLVIDVDETTDSLEVTRLVVRVDDGGW
jgi:hypothetical protein